MLQAAGTAFVTPDRRVLLLKRAGDGDHFGKWCFPAGVVEHGESPSQAARREAIEEAGDNVPEGDVTELDRRPIPRNGEFVLFRQRIAAEFAPTLNDEHSEFMWAYLDDPPDQLHPGVKAQMARVAMDGLVALDRDTLGRLDDQGINWRVRDRLAFDRATVRSYDQDGRMHVATTNISKAAVNPYLGSEIPDYETLGLDPDKIYKLLRDPEELAKAAPTFNRLPLLSKHVPVSAEDHQPDIIIGATGSDAVFDSPFLKNSLVVWAKNGIDAVEDETQKELSSAYRYRADMTPGNYEGEAYDGVMRDIVGNHVAAVKAGRAGPDVVVGDSKPEFMTMVAKAAPVLTRKAVFVAGALASHLATKKIAQDAKLDIPALLDGVTTANFKDKKAGIYTALTAQLKGKIAKDESITDVVKLLDRLQDTPVAEGDDIDDNSGLPVLKKKEEDPDDVVEEDADPMAQALAFLQGKLSDEDLAQLTAMLKPDTDGATDETAEVDPKDKDKDNKGAQDQPPAFRGMPKVGKGPGGGKGAMDSAAVGTIVTAAVKAAQSKMANDQKAIRDAERAVRPYVGELTIAYDSADKIYAAVLKDLGIETKGVHPSAFPALLAMCPKPDADGTGLAQDEQVERSSDFATRFPDAARIQV